MSSKDCSTSADGRLPDERKVVAEDKAESTGGDVEKEELERAHLSFHLRRREALCEDVEEKVDDTGVEEDGKHEAEALIGVLGRREPTEPADVADRTYV